MNTTNNRPRMMMMMPQVQPPPTTDQKPSKPLTGIAAKIAVIIII